VASPFHIDVAHARTPEASFYTDAEAYRREIERMFGKSWQLVGHLGQLTEPGDFFTTEVCGESLLVVNDTGTLRPFLNVCRHRAGPVAEGCGCQKLFACRYHGWVYDLSGQLVRAPEMEEVAGFDPAQVRLEAARVESWGPLLFVALDPEIPPLAQFFPQLGVDCAPYAVRKMRFVSSRTYPVNANWNVYVDNFLEGYHIPLVHPALNRELDYRRYATTLRERYTMQSCPVREQGAELYRASAGDPPAGYFWLYPNMMLNLYQGLLQANVVMPRAVDSCDVRFDWFAPEPVPDPTRDGRWRELVDFSDQVQTEDAGMCERVQRNLRSRAYRPLLTAARARRASFARPDTEFPEPLIGTNRNHSHPRL
jgi:choline monooxygenase